MRHHSRLFGIFAITCGLLASAPPARAAAETWVSGIGNDAGDCPITAPCRTFQFAHKQTSNNGSINVLSAGNFGPVTITKSISIVADGVEAVINTQRNGAAIMINAAADDVISLRGLTIDLRGTDNQGIDFVSGAALHVKRCVIRNTGFNALQFRPSTGTSELVVIDSVVTDSALIGINVRPTGSGNAKATLDNVRVANTIFGSMVFRGTDTTGTIAGTVRNSVATGASSAGLEVSESGGGATTVMVDHSAIVQNSIGLSVSGGAIVRIGDSAVSGNGAALSASSGGVIESYGTNKVNGNGILETPTTIIQMK